LRPESKDLHFLFAAAAIIHATLRAGTIGVMHEGNCFHLHRSQPELHPLIGVKRDLEKRVFEHKRKLYEGFTATTTATGSCGLTVSPILRMQSDARNS
jgi:hypothetical protein